MREQEYEVRDKGGRWYSLRVRPYMTLDKKVNGAVLVLVDIDAQKCAEQTAAARDYAENTVETVQRYNLLVYVLPGQSTVGHPAPARAAGGSPAESTSIDDFQVEHDFEQLGRHTMLLNARRIHDPQRKGDGSCDSAIEDITERQRERKRRCATAASL